MRKWIMTAAVLMTASLFSMPAMADDMAPAKLGKTVTDFTLTNVETGKEWSLSDNKGAVTVLVFQSTTCPWDRMRDDGGYQRVLKPLAAKWAGKNVKFVAINANKTESDAQVKKYAEKNKIGYPIVRDPGAKIAGMFGAQTTPHIFVIDEQGVLVYRGGIEKAPGNPAQCGQMSEQYLEPVLVAITENKPLPYTETKSKGCSIKR